MHAPLHPLEPQRLAALEALRILDTSVSVAWDRLARLAALTTTSPIALISLVDQDRQWFKAAVGLDVRETSRELSFCAHAILGDEPFIIPDAKADPRFADNGLVTGDPHIEAYAGAIIRNMDGLPMGTVCAIDRRTRDFTETQIEALQLLADEASSLLAWRRISLDAHDILKESQKLGDWQNARDRTDFTMNVMRVFLDLTQLRDHVDGDGRDAFVRLRRDLDQLRDRILKESAAP